MNKNTNDQKKDLIFKNHRTRPKRKRTAVLVGLISLLFFIGVSAQYGANCQPPYVYNSMCTTWSYADDGICDPSYNCLAYAIGVTNQWIWPWGSSNGTSSQVTSYLSTKGFYSSGYNSKIISYGPSYNSIAHFSKVIDSSSCRAKCGQEDLLDHNSWDPYKTNPYVNYGSKQKVYYGTRFMQVSIDGPTYLENEGDYQWCANVLYGTSPYSYKWYFSGAEYDYELMSTSSCVDFSGIFSDDVYIELEVTDAYGYHAWDTILVTVGEGDWGESEPYSRESFSIKERIAASVSNLLDEAAAKNIFSGNPYDYIDSDYYREIVQMGPVALMTIRKMILTSKENGLKEYILAIASEEIAKVDLKGDSFAWTNAREYCREWEKHMRTLSTNVANIFASDLPIENKNAALVKLGVPAIPYIIDEIARGKNEFKSALKTLLKGVISIESESAGDAVTLEKKNRNIIRVLRRLTDYYNKR